MKHLACDCQETLYQSAIFDSYFKGLHVGVLDIETTGLSPAVNKFILGGLYDCESHVVHQYFAESRCEESVALAGFLHELSKFDMIITYNGRHFDIPFLEKRRRLLADSLTYASRDTGTTPGTELMNLASCMLPYNLDLYIMLSAHSPIRKFVPNLKQKTIENYMGLWQTRSDEISGAESVELYNRYERTRDHSLEEKILLHNSDDILQLTRLTKAIAKCDFHKAMFHMGFPAENLLIENIKAERDRLTVSGRQRGDPIDYMGFSFDDYPVESDFDKRSAAFTISLPLVRDCGMAILDLEAARVATDDFSVYPGYGSGFLIIEEKGRMKYMETNHFIRVFLKRFLAEINSLYE